MESAESKRIHLQEVIKRLKSYGNHVHQLKTDETWDLIAVDWPRGIVTCIQCKVVGDMATAKRLLSRFRADPPRVPAARIHQCLEVKVKGSTEVLSCTV